jgi:hypothetical protein
MLTTEALVDQIHQTPTKGVVIVTGGGTGIFGKLLERGGGSATLISGRIPYDEQETVEILGGKPEKFVSEATTRQLAMAAFQMALKRRTGSTPVFGVACSSSLQKTPVEREGREHHIYAALQTGTKTVSLSLTLKPYMREGNGSTEQVRLKEETVNVLMLLNLIAEGCDLKDRVQYEHFFIDDLEAIKRRESNFVNCPFVEQLIEGTLPGGTLVYEPKFAKKFGVTLLMQPLSGQPVGLIPGSFNPATPAHFEMAEYADSLLVDGDCDFELSIRNADKPCLDFISLEERLATVGDRRVWITNAPTFVEKANLFPGTTFAVGYDTAIRIMDPKYSGSFDGVLSEFEENNTTFIIFGRTINGEYTLDIGKFPERFLALATVVHEPLQNSAVSSTAIRNQTAGNGQ